MTFVAVDLYNYDSIESSDNMKKKKGFTLVELLAVITILAIIGLIATPLVIKYVNEAKKDSIEESLNGIERAALTYFTSENIRNSAVVDLTTNTIEINNKDISKGLVVGNREGVKIYIYKNGYCGIKTGDNIVVKEVNENECNFNIDDSIEIVTTNKVSKEQKITGYRIYGDTVDNNSLGSSNNQVALRLTGKNLYNLPISSFVSSTSTFETYNNGYRLKTKESSTGNQINTASAYRFDLANGKYTLCAEAQFEGEFYKSDGSTPTNISPVLSIYNVNAVTGNKYQYSSSEKDGDKYFVYLNFEVTNDNKVGYLRIFFNDLASVRTWNTQGIIWNIQIIPGTINNINDAAYEPYIEPKEYIIKLKEPLRKLGDKVDYIDSSISQIVRNVGVKEDGTLYELETPTYEYIKLPTISNLNGTTVVSVSDSNLNASKIEIMVQK